MCSLMGVTRSSYYSYQERQEKRETNVYHKELIEAVKSIGKASYYSYGTRRMRKALAALSYRVGHYKTRSLMLEAGVKALIKRRYRSTTDSNHKLPIFTNVLNRDFRFESPNEAYVGDITCIWTNEGWLYLSVFIDLFSRKVVGWSMASRMRTALVCDALQSAIGQRQPDEGLIVHSDQGAQYASAVYRRLLKHNRFVGSMSRRANCWDNSVSESFFGSLKKERVQWRSYSTRIEARRDILEYISVFYNSQRLHSYLGYTTPNQFEDDWWDSQ